MKKKHRDRLNVDFPQMVRDFTPMVYNTCYHLLKNRENAEDLTQDVFLRAVRSWNGYRGDADVHTWLNRIAVNLCLNYIRDRKRNKRTASLVPLPEDGSGHHLEDTEAAGSNPEEELDAMQRRRLLDRAVAALPDQQRMVVILQKYCGHTQKEVAAILKKSVPAVDALLSRAKTNLRRHLAEALEFLKNLPERE